MNSPVRMGVSPAATSTPTHVFNQWFEALFPQAGALGLRSLFRSPFVPPSFSACKCGAASSTSRHLIRSASCCLAHPAPQSAAWLGPPVAIVPTPILQPPPCRESSLPRWPVSAPPTGLDECVFSISLVVGLPYSLIFCQFWLFFVFKLLSFFWLCEEAQCIYLRLHLGWKSQVASLLDK